MNMTIVALLSGLAGSILTIILEKLLDYLTIKEQNEHELKRAFYERKLIAAEAAVSHWTNVISAVGLLSNLYDKFAAKEENLNYEVFFDLEENYTALLNEANLSKNEFSSAILLYFDINEEKFWNSEAVKDIFENLSALRSIFHRAEELNLQRNEVSNVETIKNIDEALNKLEEQTKEQIKNLSEIYSDAQVVAKKYLQQIRNEMKKYEY